MVSPYTVVTSSSNVIATDVAVHDVPVEVAPDVVVVEVVPLAVVVVEEPMDGYGQSPPSIPLQST